VISATKKLKTSKVLPYGDILTKNIAKNVGMTEKSGPKFTPKRRKRIKLVDFTKAVYN